MLLLKLDHRQRLIQVHLAPIGVVRGLALERGVAESALRLAVL